MNFFSSNLDFKKYIAITIAIEKHSLIDQTLIENFQPDPGYKKKDLLKKVNIHDPRSFRYTSFLNGRYTTPPPS
jgi:hypothetical protein